MLKITVKKKNETPPIAYHCLNMLEEIVIINISIYIHLEESLNLD